jgi:hypothetical protein
VSRGFKGDGKLDERCVMAPSPCRLDEGCYGTAGVSAEVAVEAEIGQKGPKRYLIPRAEAENRR